MAYDASFMAHPPPLGGGGHNKFVLRLLSSTNPEQLFHDLEGVQPTGLMLYGFKSFNESTGVGTDNSADINFGGVDGNGDYILPEVIAKGVGTGWNPPVKGTTYPITDLWFRGSSGDGVLAVYS